MNYNKEEKKKNNRRNTKKCNCSYHSFINLNGFLPELWGSPTHSLQHLLASFWQYRATNKERLLFVEFMECLLILLFCRTCRESFNNYYKHDPFDSQQSWTLYLCRVHAFVTHKQGKPSLPLEKLEEMYLPEDSEKLSPYFMYCFWMVLYLFALNFPPIYKSTLTRHKQIHTAFIRMIDTLIPHLIPPTSLFSQEYNKAYQLVKAKKLEKKEEPNSLFNFKSRSETFHFIYEIQKQLKMNVLGNCLQTQIYFEKIFRTVPSLTTSKEVKKSK